MPSKIDQNLIPPVIRESVDPEILNRAQSIEWSIDRDTGENEHGYLDGGHEDYLSSQNLLPKSHGQLHYGAPRKQVEWHEQTATTTTTTSGRDSGLEASPTTPSLYGKPTGGGGGGEQLAANLDFAAGNKTNTLGQMKRHPTGVSPFPMYKVNQEQLQGDVFFEVAPRAAPGERTVHFEKTSRILNQQEMDALGLDPSVFGPNSRTAVHEDEEETVETSVLKGDARQLEEIYNSMRTGAGDYFEHERARSLSPVGSRRPVDQASSEQKKTVIFGSLEEIDQREQEYFPYRDAHQGKPLPGDNEYGTWGSRFDEQRQWKLCNGQWVRVAEPKPKPKPKQEKYLAERLKCKPPRRGLARSVPVRQVEPQGSTDSEADSDSDADDQQPAVDFSNLDLEPLDLGAPRRRPARAVDVEPAQPRRRDSFRPLESRRPLDEEPAVDLDALRDKYRPKAEKEPSVISDDDDDAADDGGDSADDTKASPETTGTILLEPIRPPTPPLEEIKVEPIQQTYVEMKKPLKQPDGEEEKLIEDPNLMWMHMGPAQYGPPLGSMKRRKAREEEWIGPPCELCHKQIEERRCMLAENMKFHCWHFACSFCLKTLKPADFLIAEADKKPYCLNCHKREFPEISLVNLHLEE